MFQRRSYYNTTNVTPELMREYIRACVNQEEKIIRLFQEFGQMTKWDGYDLYNNLIGPILDSSVGRSFRNLELAGIIEKTQTQVIGDTGRPNHIFRLIPNHPAYVSRNTGRVATKVSINIYYNEDGDLDVLKMYEELELQISRLN